MGNPGECLSILSAIDLDAPLRISSPRNSLDKQSTGVSAAVQRSVSVTSTSIKGPSDTARLNTLCWTLERLRARCEEGELCISTFRNIQRTNEINLGMSQEILNKPSAALAAYDAGLRLLQSVDYITSAHDEKAQPAAFRELREFWRWGERTLRRRAIVASRRL